MTLEWKVVKAPKSGAAAPTTQSIQNIGFTPKAVIIYSSGSNVELVSPMRPGMGVGTTTDNRSISWGSDDELDYTLPAGTNAFRRCSEEYCFMLGSGGSSGFAKIKVSAFNTANGGEAVFTYDANDASTFDLNYIFLGGADITNTKVGSFNLSLATGTQDIHSVGFRPDMVLFFGANVEPQTGASTFTSTPGAVWFMGAGASNPVQQNVMGGVSLDAISGPSGGKPSHAARYQRNGTGTNSSGCIAIFDESTVPSSPSGLWAEASFNGPLDDGFSLNVITAPPSTSEAAARPIFYLAIKGGTFRVGSFNSPAASGDQTVTGTPALPSVITPKGVLLYGDQDIPRTTIDTDSDKMSIGAADGVSTAPADQWSCYMGDNNTPSDNFTWTVRGSRTGAIFRSHRIQKAPSATTDFTSTATFSSFGAGNFVLNWTYAETTPNQRQVLYIAAGDSPPGAALIKAPTVNPDAIGITETVVKRRGLVRKPSLAEPIGITETVVRRRGLVKVVGGLAAGTGGAFTEQGFLSEGFVTGAPAPPSGAGPYFVSGDYNVNDYMTTVAPPAVPTGQEYIGISEIVVKLLVPATAEFVTPGNLVFVYSGGASYDGSSTGATLSVGGAMSSVQVSSGTLRSAWDDVANTEASSSDTEYRLFYLKNTHPTLTAYSVRIWIAAQTPGGDRVEIGIAAAGPNSVETAITNENGPAPSAVSFSTAPDENGALNVGDLPAAGGFRGIWIKRIVPAATFSFVNNSYSLSVSLASSHA